MRSRIPLTVAALALALSACSTPQHSNTLIFGTNTKVAFDVSADQIKQTPSVTLGYTRQEGVWMPLMPNAADKEGNLVPCERLVEAGNANEENAACSKFVGTQGSQNQDTYSVLASFGADFSGGSGVDANGAQASGTAGIAQYFATGLAHTSHQGRCIGL